MKQVKCLSILQPWASLVVSGEKRIETRSWNTNYRGELYIHASARDLKWNKFENSLIEKLIDVAFCTKVGNMLIKKELPLGAIIGKVDLIGVDTTESLNFFEKSERNGKVWHLTKKEESFGDYSPNRYGWLLANPVMFDKPIPAKGKLMLWNWSGEIDIQ